LVFCDSNRRKVVGRHLDHLAIGLASLLAGGCALGLRPHTTLDGLAFPADRAASIRQGQTSDEVADILGEPFEYRDLGDGTTVWRYFEEFHPRGCQPAVFGIALGERPTWRREVLVTLKDDRTESVKVVGDGMANADRIGTSQNNKMQRTREPASIK
jgi:outer membrane protein assembly factor BamE (lipoprotein component of BamABCDE complex)